MGFLGGRFSKDFLGFFWGFPIGVVCGFPIGFSMGLTMVFSVV